MKLVIVVPSTEANGLGRGLVFADLARCLGLDLEIIGPGRRLWEPVATTEYSDAIEVVPPNSWGSSVLAKRVEPDDFVVAVKPLVASLGVVWECLREGTLAPSQAIFDHDDADLEWILDHPSRRVRYGIVSPKVWRSDDQYAPRLRLTRSRMRRHAWVTASNPSLGRSVRAGTIIPHAREWRVPELVSDLPHGDVGPKTIGFIGTAKKHKGIGLLRKAAVLLSSSHQLVVTDRPPADARPNETWVGNIPYSEKQSFLAGIDMVVLPQQPSIYAAYQLPAKLIDAMSTGTYVIASDTPPIRWALNGAGTLISTAASASELAESIIRIDEGSMRAFATVSQRSLRGRFGIQAVAHKFWSLLEQARIRSEYSSP